MAAPSSGCFKCLQEIEDLFNKKLSMPPIVSRE